MNHNQSTVLSVRTASLLLSFLLGACGADVPVTTADAGVDSGIAPPAPPAPPVLTPCPAGWREVTDAHGLVTCDPWPESGYRTGCAFDEAHFAGTPGCARVGTECAADGWPSDLPSDRAIVYVDDGAAPGGDGASRGTAFQRIREAVSASPDGAVIAVATGLYDEIVGLPTGVTLWGACVAGTRLVTSAPSETDGALTFYGDGSGARNLGIDGVDRIGVSVAGASAASIDDVVVARGATLGILMQGGSMTATGLVVRGIRPRTSDGGLGRGVNVEGGAHSVLTRVVVEDNREIGISVAGAGTSVEASDVVVRGTRERASDRTGGLGIDVQGGAHSVLTHVVVEDNRDTGIYVDGAGTSVEASDVVVRGTREQASDGTFGFGVVVKSGAHFVPTRTLIDDNRAGGIDISGAGTSVEASNLVVRGTRERASDHGFGQGILVSDGARFVLTLSLIDDNRMYGIIVDGVGTVVEASDVVVRATREPASSGVDGEGIDVQFGAQVVLSRAVVEDSRMNGVLAVGVGTTVHLTDTVVRATREVMSGGTMGAGIQGREGAGVVLLRVLVDDNRDWGVVVVGAGTSVEASELVVRDTLPQSADGTGGAGVWAQLGAQVVLTGARVQGSHWVGVGSVAGANVVLRDVVVSGIESSHCIDGVCVGETGGFGLVAIYGGTLAATDFVVEGVSLCAVMVGRDDPTVATPSSLDLESGVIDRSMIGACVQVDGYDTTRLQHGVEYRDVGVPLRATSYEVPSDLPSGATP